MRFIIEGDPIPKMRPRFMRRGPHVITFDPQEKVKQRVRAELEEQFKSSINAQNKQIVIEASNLVSAATFDCTMSFYLPMPDSWSEAKKNEKLWRIEECNCKPDLDNLEKFYLDCMNGVIFEDDKQIVTLQSRKRYSRHPKTIIDIMPRKDLSISEQSKGILQVFGPHELMEFITDVWDLFELYDVDEEDDVELDRQHGGSFREVRLARTAITLSKVADKHAKAFKKINSRYPDFWKECHCIAASMEEANVLEEPREEGGGPLYQEANNGTR